MLHILFVLSYESIDAGFEAKGRRERDTIDARQDSR